MFFQAKTKTEHVSIEQWVGHADARRDWQERQADLQQRQVRRPEPRGQVGPQERRQKMEKCLSFHGGGSMAQCPKLVINHWLGCQKEYRVDKEHCTLEMEAWAAYTHFGV